MRYNRIFLFLLAMTLFLGSCQRTRAAQTEPQGDFLQKVTFLGDSITAHMAARRASILSCLVFIKILLS